MEMGGLKLTLEPMRFWLVERKREGIPRKRKYDQRQGRGNECGGLGRHQDGPDWKVWRINLRSILRVILKSLELSLKAMGDHRRHLDIGKTGPPPKIHAECFSYSMGHFSISNDCGWSQDVNTELQN